MLIRTHIPAAEALADPLAAHALELSAAQRRRVRQRIEIDGREIGLALAPGTQLVPGDQLLADDGTRFEVCAAAEAVLRIEADSPLALTRAAYHLGNRHVAVEIGEGWLAIEPDAVLQDMLERMGLRCSPVEQPFEPDFGAYGGGHRHGHDETFADDYRLAQSVYTLHGHAHPPGTPAHSHALP